MMSQSFTLPEQENEMREFMRENPAHRLLKIEDGMAVLTGSDIPPEPEEEHE